MKYPEYRQAFKNAQWFGGHLCFQNGVYYKLVRVEGEKEKILKQFTYDELGSKDKSLIEESLKNEEKEAERLRLLFNELIPAREKLIDYVQANGNLVDRSCQSESEYWYVKSPVNGMSYKVRISGHVYPTGSMTDLALNVIDTTDCDCRRFLKLFNI